MSHVFILKGDPLGSFIRFLTCFLQVIAECRDTEHPSAICDYTAGFVELRSGMEAERIVLTFKFLKSFDGESLFVLYGISVTCKHYADGSLIGEFKVDLIKLSVYAGIDNIKDVILKPGKNNLRFGIAEPRIVLENPGALRCEHESEENDSVERPSFSRHRINGGLEYILLAELIYFLGIERSGGEIAHSAGIETGVSVARSLVILCGRHYLDDLAVDKRKNAYFTSGHELFDDHLISCGTELLVLHDGLNTLFGIGKSLTYENSLSESKSVSLKDDGEFRLGPEIFESLFGIVKILVSCGGNSVFLHKILGESLAAFDYSGILSGTECPDAGFFKFIDKSADKGIVHSHDNKIDRIFFRE